MRNVKRRTIATVAVTLTILTAFLLPVQVFAEAVPESEETETVVFDSLGESADEANIVSEITEKRDEYTKHFRMDDGTIMAVTYGCPVHYKNSKGKWAEYDNSLVSVEATPDEAAPRVYSNKKSDVDIKISQNARSSQLVNISTKKGDISWKYTGVKKSNAKIIGNKNKRKGNDRYTALDNLTSQTDYKNIYENVDLNCIVTTTGVKENIVLKNPDARNEFEIEYKIKGLTAKQTDERTIELLNKKGKSVYTITSPYMYDADGNQSADLSMEILSSKNNKLKVKLTADKGFINSWGRAYPVTIDPEVSVNGSANTTTAQLCVNNPSAVQGQQTHFLLGKNSSGTEYTGVVKSEGIEDAFADKNVVSAKLSVYPLYAALQMEVEAYPVTSSWTNGTATYNNVTYTPEVIDYATAPGVSADGLTFDITKTFKQWCGGSLDNNGIYLKCISGYAELGGYYIYYPEKRPTFTVKYKEYTGSESNLTSHTVSCGQDAEASVCDYTGSLTVKQNIYEEKGNRIPLSIYTTYHSTQKDVRGYIGKGWHMSFDKSLSNTGTYYVYRDSDGAEHYFKIEEGKTELYDEDDSGYTLTVNSSTVEIDNASVIEEYDIPQENETVKIKSETDADNDNNKITYTYNTSDKLTKIASAQHTYTFSYSNVTSDADNTTVTICNAIYKDSSVLISFIYYAGYDQSSGIRFSDGKRSTLQYVNHNNGVYLGTIRQYSTSDSTDGQKLGFSYTSGKVTRITEYGKNGASRKALSIVYNDDNTTEFTDKNGNKETYTFDNYGNTVTVLNSNGYITNGSDSNSLNISTGSDSYTKNYIEASNEFGGIGSGYYYKKGNGTIGNQTSSGGQVSIATDMTYLGQSSVRVAHSGSSQIYTYAMHESDIGDLAGKTVTLSSYVMTSRIEEGSLSGGAGAIIKFKCLNSSGSALLDKNSVPLIETSSGSEGWIRLSLTVTIPSAASKYRIYFGLRNCQGTAWFDCMQLEESDVMNDYNALANSDFTSTSDWIYTYKDTDDTSFNTTSIPLNSDGDVQLSGRGCEPAEDFSGDSEETEATVATETKIETETIENAVVDSTDSYGNVTKTMQGKVTRTYKRTYEVTEATEENSSSGNESDNDDVDSVKDCNNYIYQVLDVNQKYVTFNISGTAKARSVPLNSDYRTFGIALKIKYTGDSDFTESHYQEFNAYTDATQNIALSVTPEESDKLVEKVAFAFVYGYNKNEMIIKNAMLNFAYDYKFSGSIENDNSSSGNQTVSEIDEEIISESVSTAQTYMQTSSTYNSTGNYVTSESDEAGHTTSYTYDSDGNKTSVTDAKSNTTSYAYDTYGNILSVASGDSSYSNAYTSTGQISSIYNDGNSYTFEYDDFDNVTKVKVGTQTLVTNTYDSLCDKLTCTTYGNGNYIQYTYDDYNRITSISVAGMNLAEYTYNKKGLITKCYDGWQDLSTYYYYDCNGNLIAKYAEDDDTNLAYFVWLDGANTVETTKIDGVYHHIVSGTDSDDCEYVKNDGVLVTTRTDDFGRKEDVATQFTLETGDPTFHTEYEYLGGSATNSTTNLIGNITYSYGNDSTEYDYLYDANDNITQIKTDGTVVAKYTYDSLNQLKTSADKNADTYTEYNYDNKGNITSTKVYSLTSSLGKGSTLQKTNTYTYGDSNWGDKLTGYNGQTITYDEIGNPLNYRDGMTLNWKNGKHLEKLITANDTVEYTYNADGLRTSKEDSDFRTLYYYDDNSNMVGMKKGGMVLYFQYDSEGNAVSMQYDDSRYYFVKNQQGDAEKIVNRNGVALVTYKYDAWGNLCGITDSTNFNLGKMNPYRYRSYIYDDESGLYYLRSRYYDPKTGRFLNADDTAYIGATETALSSNVFACCENNIINYVDNYGFAKSKVKCCFTTLEYKYKITSSGVVQFYFDNGNDYWGALWRGKTRKLAKKIYDKARKKGKEKGKTYLLGRTIGGVDVELKLHWLAYTLNIAKDHANPADIGGTDIDDTAWFFESTNALLIAKKFTVTNVWNMADSIRRIKDYF